MSSTARRGTLPGGREPTVSSLPSYLTETHPTTANDSTESNESFLSQIPLPFHMDENSESPPHNRNFHQYRAEREESAPLALQEAPSDVHIQSSPGEKMLDPNSIPYVPTGNSPLMAQMHAFEARVSPGMGNINGQRQDLASIQTYQQPYGYGQHHHGRMPSLPPNPYRATGSTAGYQAGNTSHQYGATYGNPSQITNSSYQTNNPSAQFGGCYSHGNSNDNAPGPYYHPRASASMAPHGNYPAAQPSTTHPGYGGLPESFSTSCSEVSPDRGYGTVSTSQTSYQSLPYSSGGGSGVPSLGYAASLGFRQGFPDPYFPAEQSTFNNNNSNRRQSHPTTMNYKIGNSYAERMGLQYGNGSGGNNNGLNSNYANFANHSSQNNRPSMGHDNGYNNQNANQNLRTHLRSDSGTQKIQLTRDENRGALTRYFSPDDVGRNIVNTNPPNSASLTDSQRQPATDIVSETRRTPKLRSRRGQSIASASQSNKDNKLTVWSGNTPPLQIEGLKDATNRARSPAKSTGLVLAGISESDPFWTPGRKEFKNPFAPAPTPLLTLRAVSLNRSLLDGASAHYRRLTNNGTRLPSVEEGLDFKNLPFAEYCRNERPGPDNFGVIRIRNIPYSVDRQEILAFLGRNARLVPEFQHEPIHIVMERVTSKTLDCYVEYKNLNEAVNAVNRFETNKNGGRGGRLGQRHVEIELSSQDQLMKDLFPKAKNVKWNQGKPEILPVNPNDHYNSGFKGFVSKEELIMLVKHVETPQRSPFSKDCPQRPFECLISTLIKYPWYMVQHITIEDRNLLHVATKALLTMLVNHVAQNREDTRLNGALLKRAWRAVLACSGFTPTMKDDIALICDVEVRYAVELGLAPQAADWRYLWTIGPKRGVETDVLMFYIGLIRDITVQQRPRLTLAEQAAKGGGASSNEYKLFGDLDKLIQYPPRLAHCTLHDVAQVEWAAIEMALRRALTPALQ